MRLTDEMVELDDREYRDRNVLAELKYMGREIKHRKTVTNDDLRFMAWLYRSALNLMKEQEAKTGHWIFESQCYEAWTHTCSECGKRMTTAVNTFANWCWNCGAKMETGGEV